jgi:hypothetical protein
MKMMSKVAGIYLYIYIIKVMCHILACLWNSLALLELNYIPGLSEKNWHC